MTQYGLSHGQYLKARRIKAHRPGSTVKYIAQHVGATERQVRDALDFSVKPAMPRNKNSRQRKPDNRPARYVKCGHRKVAGIAEPGHMVVPHDVIAERDRRLSVPPPSLTAACMGDPPPGYSALDKRHRA